MGWMFSVSSFAGFWVLFVAGWCRVLDFYFSTLPHLLISFAHLKK
jgi:hypothetical protein